MILKTNDCLHLVAMCLSDACTEVFLKCELHQFDFNRHDISLQ